MMHFQQIYNVKLLTVADETTDILVRYLETSRFTETIRSLDHLVLNLCWILLLVAAIRAFRRAPSRPALLQCIGLGLLVLNFLSGILMIQIVRDSARFDAWYAALAIPLLLVRSIGVILFALGYCLEKFRRKSPLPATVPIGSPPPLPVESATVKDETP